MNHEELFARSGAAAWGTCAFSDLTLSPDAKEQALHLCPNAKGVYVAAYPYFAGYRPGNLSLYARGEDYHRSLRRRLAEVVQGLEELFPGNHFVPGADSSPLDERQCAKLAGVGLQGRNGLVIVEPFGSWVFLGTILTDLYLPSAPEPAPACIQCGACVRACPTGALEHGNCSDERCLSALTQKKGELTDEEQALLRTHPLVWGCDLCQRVCPYNRSPLLSPLPDLTGEGEVPYLASLRLEDLEGLSNRGFRARYGDRAFAWRGAGVLRRNLGLKE